MEFKQVAYTPEQVSKLFGREKTWGYRRIYDGTFKPITVGGRKLIPTKQIENLLDGGNEKKLEPVIKKILAGYSPSKNSETHNNSIAM